MSFPKNVSEEALLACGRRCCICHKFCSGKIETHHIESKPEGDDTFENCIPLCFDCHADVRAYDPKHPKGRKYTTSELKGHRDRWYEKVRKNPEIVSDVQQHSNDIDMFNHVIRVLPSTGVVDFVRNHDYNDRFQRSEHSPLKEFVRMNSQPEFEFLNQEIENSKISLVNSVNSFLDSIGRSTSSLILELGDPNIMGQEPSLRRTQPELYNERVQEMNKAATELTDTYDEFIRKGRRVLGVTYSDIEKEKEFNK